MPPRMSKLLKLISKKDAKQLIVRYRKEHEGELTFIDIGGKHGARSHFANGFKLTTMDINPNSKAKDLVVGDICKPTGIPDCAYDVTFTHNVLEHTKEPWVAAEECVRITKVGGLTVHMAPFAWRYHPVPEDYFRFSHEGLRYLFERIGMVKTLLLGYDISVRRDQFLAPHEFKDNEDVPPYDKLGGWRENWETIYVGQRTR